MTTLTRKGRLALKTQGAWGTAETSFSATDYMDVNAPFVPPMKRESQRADVFRPGLGHAPITLPGSKVPTDIQVSGDLHGWSTSTPSGNPSAFPDALLLGRALGGESTPTGYTTQLASGASTSAFKYTDGQGSTGWNGFAQNVPISGGRAIGWLAAVDTTTNPDTGTLEAAITAAHSSSGVMYGSHVVYNHDTDNDPTPLTLQWLGTAAADQLLYFDVAVRSYTLTLESKKAPMFAATLAALDWTQSGSGGAPADYAYGYPKVPVWTGTNGARAYLNGTARCYQRVVITIENTLDEGPCHSSTQGVSQWYVSERAITIETIRLITDTSAITAVAGDTPGLLQIDLATTPGRSVSVMANVQVREQPEPIAIGNLVGERVLYDVIPYSGDTGSNGPANRALKIAFM